ncbi:ABC transporter ATP-binding protein [Nocardioides daeguensis]|uniref:ABC transporter ATP-binding protein n=1 Tax=Nocardioides daeguensis TaxID=908359 RepID=A0ABP6WEJ3_9ACTN|nr:ABC transporter ATP-binding protein [Nocardioides daeguensis]MBV6728012.1 ABC transporter ATP-binding protein [Nocardioides daeguensis]MCR1774086.1 ABC transporter ATP-binding protein [Nocardioides daeguensis]
MSLRLENITVAVPDGTTRRVLLDRLDLGVQPGETVAVTGASGSGKSTLVAVAGLLRAPDEGRVLLGGTDATALNDRGRVRLRRDQVGIVFQSPNLLPALTAREQVEVVAHIAGALDATARARAVDLLERVGLADRLDARPAELSGGERQRVGIARALMNEPTVVLADEPTASLDPERGQAVLDLLLDEARRVGAATVVVTHDPDQAARADRHLHLSRGTIQAGSRA